MNRLEEFLNAKPLYYDKIDTIRMTVAYDSIKSYFEYNGNCVHIIGTNGKGSTGRFLAQYLHRIGKSVGHYTSPHILEFRERIWIDDRYISDDELDTIHQKLLSILSKEFINTLTYFEYTTFVAMLFFVQQDVDYIVLEAGLGGEYDATSVFRRDLSLLTTVDFDHTEFLGNTIEAITTTKVNSVSKALIIGYQTNLDVIDIAKTICAKRHLRSYSLEDFITIDDLSKINSLKMANFLKNNLKLTISALKLLGYNDINYHLFADVEIFGRFYRLFDNVTIDVGHNLLASVEVANELEDKKIYLIYNTYKDKDYENILKNLKQVIQKVLIIDVKNNRIEDRYKLENTLKKLDIDFDTFEKIEDTKEYLVFGSFSVVEEFLKKVRV